VNTTQFHDLPQISNECNRLLEMPRVAIMFLARGDMYHEEVWARWFAGAKELIPKPTLQVRGCSLDLHQANHSLLDLHLRIPRGQPTSELGASSLA